MRRNNVKNSILAVFLSLATSQWSYRAMALDLKADEIRGEQVNNPVKILQNRYFTKTFRPEIGLSLGSFVNEAYGYLHYRFKRLLVY